MTQSAKDIKVGEILFMVTKPSWVSSDTEDATGYATVSKVNTATIYVSEPDSNGTVAFKRKAKFPLQSKVVNWWDKDAALWPSEEDYNQYMADTETRNRAKYIQSITRQLNNLEDISTDNLAKLDKQIFKYRREGK